MREPSPRRGADPASDQAPAHALPRRAATPASLAREVGRHGPSRALPHRPRRFSIRRAGVLGLGAVALALIVAIGYFAIGPRSAVPTAPATPPSTDTGPSSYQGTPVVLDDTTIVMPTGWEIYADEKVQDDRRLVRMRDRLTKVRLQAVTLTSVKDTLPRACSALVEQQSGSFTLMALTPAFTIPVAPGGEGYSCGFTGVGSADDLAGQLSFTLIRRDSDGHTLVLRDFQPRARVGSPEVTAELGQITCSAADGFDVSLTRCR